MNKFINKNSNKKEETKIIIEKEKQGIFEIFIKRPVLAIVINLIITLVGFVTWQNLYVRELPKLNFPAIRVSTEYPGAGPNVIESQITIPLEEAFAGLPGLDYMESSTSNGESKISLHFNNKQNIDASAAEVRDRVMKAKHAFPPSLRDPTISKFANDERELIRLVTFGDKYNLSEIGDQIQRYAKGQIESIPGVAAVRIFGVSGGGDSGAFQIHAIISPEKLYAYDLSIKDLRESIYQNSFKQPLGEIIQNDIAFSITLNQKATGVEDYKKIILKQRNYGAVRLQDVADVQIITSDPDSIVRYKGKPCVMMSVIAQQGANPIEISKSIKKKLGTIKKSLPKNLSLEIATDRSETINQSIKSVYKSIIEATIFVFLIILLFLRSWKSTFIPMITIPICLLGGFFIIYLCDFTINLLTLLAMVLAIGLVVDDAIVVLENIYRHIENKIPPFKAAIKGLKEIQFSVIAMTLTLMAVYAPITLARGIIGKLFIEFAITLAGTVLISGIVALTLTPMLCAKLLKAEHAEEKNWQIKIRLWLENVDKQYANWLAYALENSKKVIFISITITLLAGLLAKYYIPNTLMPQIDADLIRLDFNTPSGATAKYTDTYVSKIENIVKKTPYLENYIVSLQSGGADDAIIIKLKNLKYRKLGADKILKKLLKDIELTQSGLKVNGSCPSGILGGESDENNLVTFVIQSQKSYDEMEMIANEIHTKAIMKNKYIDKNSVKISRVSPEKSYDIKINRSKAEQFNVRMAEIGDMLSFIMRGQPPADRFEVDAKRYPMRLMVSEEFKKDPNNIKKLHIRSTKSQSRESGPPLIALHDLLEINETTERPLALRYEGMRSYEFLFNVKNASAVSVYNDITKILDRTLPVGYKYAPTRSLRKALNEGSNIASIFILAFLFIFLIMAAQFESFIDPFIIILSAPMALAGGILALIFIPNGSLNIFTYIALVTLIGLITKHGILIVDFANKNLKNKNLNRELIKKAVQEAAILRLRPILMTTFAMVLGAVPLAFSSGSGYEIRSQIGWVIVGGLLIGTLFTMFLLPCVYIAIKDYVAKFEKRS